MKTIINQLIVRDTENFKRNIRKLLPKGIEEFYVNSFVLKRHNGRGSYCYVANVEVNGEILTLKKHTNDSVTFDEYTDLEYGTLAYENWVKSKFLSFLATDSVYDTIFELIYLQEHSEFTPQNL